MKNLRSLGVIASILCIPAYTQAYVYNNDDTVNFVHEEPTYVVHHQQPQQSQHTGAMMRGICIGALTGTGCAAVDRRTNLQFLPVTWLVSFAGRKALLAPALDDYSVNEARVYSETIDTSAWVSSWVSYLVAMTFLNN